MGLFSKARAAVARCSTCGGSGKVSHYRQGGNAVLDRQGRPVASTWCDKFKTCTACGGSGSR